MKLEETRLSLSADGDGFYPCHRDCSTERLALRLPHSLSARGEQFRGARALLQL